MLVRIRSRDGNFRFELQPNDDVSVLIQKILETSATIDPSTLALSNAPRGGEQLVSNIAGDLQSLGIGHGDLLFVSYTPLPERATPAPSASTPAAQAVASTLAGKTVPIETPAPSTSAPIPAPTSSTGSKKPWESAKVDAVDLYWAQRDGKIERKKGVNGCRCGPKAMCDYCMPLEVRPDLSLGFPVQELICFETLQPFDSNYQSEHSIKHLSFQAYLRKIKVSAPLSSTSTSYVPPLSNPSYRVQVPCSSSSHPSWPAGICTKCQPSAVTLSRQVWRMTDHVEFADPSIIERFLSFWRQSGTQRFGFLLGRYEPYEKVPMGVKAVVEAIHEPPQEPLADGVSVGFPWEDEARVARLAESCGLQVVGMIYTDLVADQSSPEKKAQGKVVCKRHANSFFLSSLEVVFAAHLQRLHPNPSRFAEAGHFSSKFVTCVLSGDLEGNVAIEAYQVSDQAMAMVEADMIEASVDPGIMRVKEEGPTRYIPDVFYRYKNKYNLEVKESAKPCFPVEYLLVNVSAGSTRQEKRVTNGFPLAPSPMFTSERPFAIESRMGLQDQSMASAASTFAALAKDLPPSQVGYSAHQDAEDGALSSSAKGKEKEGTSGNDAATPIIKWLSDWHLLAFLDQVGLFEKVMCACEQSDIELMAQIAKTKDAATLRRLFATNSWQTFLTIAQDEGPRANGNGPSSGNTLGGAPQTFDDGFEIPPDIDVPPDAYNNYDMQDVSMANAGNGGGLDNAAADGGGGAVSAKVACPHCTLENDAGSTDCVMCGLPL
ncbi:BQ5605_C008g05086 [Microbotryum silenes-dioicae]|uniref:Nuclear protein localization protein 4 n=1 Tax=Microbotryum silenes-dioicae TaxID=796604 RepID=A0A2X0MBZ1_9BASI|nr:BQ5605_C008g05086 [Microbotryum silenes-dioicae]